MSERDTTFDPDCIGRLLKTYLKENTKVGKDGLLAASEFLRLFVVEAIHRAHIQADNKEVITARDIQRILPQLLLDF